MPGLTEQRPLSPSDLISMGKRAAMDFLNNDTPLIEAVVKEAGAVSGITTEQVRRVVETANSTAFTHTFEKKAGNKVIEFDVAKPEEVLARLEGKVTQVMMKAAAAAEFSAPPPRPSLEKVATDVGIASMFGVDVDAEMEKQAGVIGAITGAGSGLIKGVKAALTTGGRAQAMTTGRSVLSHALSTGAAAAGKGWERGMNPGIEAVRRMATPVASAAAPAAAHAAAPAATAAKSGLGLKHLLGGAGVGAAAGYALNPPEPEQEPMPKYASAFFEVTREPSTPEPALLKESVFQLPVMTRGIAEVEKVASSAAGAVVDAVPRREVENSIRRAQELAVKHAEDCNDDFTMTMLRLEAEQHNLAEKCAAFVADGGSIAEVLHMMALRSNDEIAKMAFLEVLPEIEKLSSATGVKPEDMLADVAFYDIERSKTASVRQVDQTHAVVRAFDAYASAMVKQANARTALEEAVSMLEQADGHVSAFGKSAGLGTAMLAGAAAGATVPAMVQKFKGGTTAKNVGGMNPLATPSAPMGGQ